MIPKDPVMLLSYLNTMLRDYYESLEKLCAALNLDQKAITEQMRVIDYCYDKGLNKFV